MAERHGLFQFLRQNARWIAGGFLLTFFSSFGQTFFVSGSAAEWMARFDLSPGDFGRLYMLATLGSALTLPFLGKIVDVWSMPRTIALTVPVLAAACLLAAFAPSAIVLGIAVYLLRLFGQGMMVHIALTAIGRWFSAQRGRAISLVVLGHQAGEATLPLVATGLTLALGWQAVWVAGALSLLFAALPLGLWAFAAKRQPKGDPADDVPATARDWTRGEVVRDPVFWVLLTGVLAPPFIGTTIFFHQDYLSALRDWPPGLYATGFTAMAATTVLFALVCGALVDRYGARTVLPFFLIPLSASCFIAAGIEGPAGLYGFMVCLGISYGFSATLFGSLWPEIYGTAHLGAIRSIMMPFMVFATAAGPGLTGTLIDMGVPLPRQFAVMGLYCVLAILTLTMASLRLRRRQAALVDPSRNE